MQFPRPLSPHLQIYRLPLTVVLSIMHRATGVLLSLGLVVLTVWLISAAVDPVLYESVLMILSGWIGQTILIGVIATLYFHLGNGIRHLFWDAGYGFALHTVDRTAISVIIFTILATAGTWLLVLMTRGIL